ncbi:hypothetical protein BGZ96_000889 [Linnemannia gamsii]|uniref:Uncharacterized protein n=1 Tax=Linnemannia gamsii TaxID=64522 RepID=A0ABQ7JNB3_9FUNG|nr:hypothetical protein BGZ96_000889 [Linnemannia gamsii]
MAQGSTNQPIIGGIDGVFPFRANGKPKMETKGLNMFIPGTTTFMGQALHVKLMLPWNQDSAEHAVFPLAQRLWSSQEEPGLLYDIRGSYRSSTWTSGMSRRELLGTNVSRCNSAVPDLPEGVEIELPYAERQKAGDGDARSRSYMPTPPSPSDSNLLQSRRSSVPILRTRSIHDPLFSPSDEGHGSMRSNLPPQARADKGKKRARSEQWMDEFQLEDENDSELVDKRYLQPIGTGMSSSSRSGRRFASASGQGDVTPVLGRLPKLVLVEDDDNATAMTDPLGLSAVSGKRSRFNHLTQEHMSQQDEEDTELQDFDRELELLGRKYAAEIHSKNVAATKNDACKPARAASMGPPRSPLKEVSDEEMNRLLGKRRVGRPSKQEDAKRSALMNKIKTSGQSMLLDIAVPQSGKASAKRVTRSAAASQPAGLSSRAGSAIASDSGSTASAKSAYQFEEE